MRSSGTHTRCPLRSVVLLCLSLLAFACAQNPGSSASARAVGEATTGVAESSPSAVVLFIGDGMGISTVTAGRIYAGQKRGGDGESNLLSFESFPDVALIKTYNTDMQVSDSAGTMSAIVTGQKTRAGVLSIPPSVARGDCQGALGAPVETLLEKLERQGVRTGIVSTATITHATPAANYAHSADRNWEADSDMPAEALAAGCRDIATQLVEFAQHNPGSDGVDVVLGGGRAHFLPASATDVEYPDKTGKRADGRDLVGEWQAGAPDRTYVWNREQFAAAASKPGQVLGLFEPSHMQFEADRDDSAAGEPSLADMTRFAIERLRTLSGDQPFLLVVEAGRIDHAHHFNNAYRALEDTVALDNAVATASELLGESALIVVTADHSHTFTISGYPRRGNPILGLVRGPGGKLAADVEGQPYTTLGYANGSSAVKLLAGLRSGDGKLPALTDEEVAGKDYQQVSTIPMYAETHAGEDVAAYATGPGSRGVRGVMEQNRLYFVLANAF